MDIYLNLIHKNHFTLSIFLRSHLGDMLNFSIMHLKTDHVPIYVKSSSVTQVGLSTYIYLYNTYLTQSWKTFNNNSAKDSITY